MEIKYETQKLLKQLRSYDMATEIHCTRVAELVEHLTEDMDRRAREEIKTAALLHDIGKLYVPKELLMKPGSLTPLERIIVNAHAFYGYKILSEKGFPERVCCMVLMHHGENDTTDVFRTKSDLLNDETVIKGAEIISCCDIYDATTTDRPYRKALTQEKAYEAITQNLFIPREIRTKFQKLTYRYEQEIMQYS